MEEEMKKLVLSFRMPRWKELPDIDLYLDQTVTLIEKYLEKYISLNKDDKVITKTMINNYVKQGIMQPPEKKKYNKTHIAYLFVICILKQVYSINDIGELIKLTLEKYDIAIAYDRFCSCLEKSIKYVFNRQEYPNCDKMNEEQYLLKNVVQAFANKLYIEMMFLNKGIK